MSQPQSTPVQTGFDASCTVRASEAIAYRATLEAWCCQRKHGQSLSPHGAGGTDLGTWLAEVEAQLLPHAPAAVLSLAETLLQDHLGLLGHDEDADVEHGPTRRAAARLWLSAAAAAIRPPEGWAARLLQLVGTPCEAVREALLIGAGQVLDDDELSSLIDDARRELSVATTRSHSQAGVIAAVRLAARIRLLEAARTKRH